MNIFSCLRPVLLYTTIGALFLLSSCSTTFQAHQDMLLTVNEKYDLKATGSINKTETGDEELTYNGLLAFSPLKHVGLSAKYFNYKDILENSNNFFPTTSRDVSGQMTEFAIGGYFTPRLKINEETDLVEQSLLMDLNFTGDLYFGAGQGQLDLIYGKSAEQHLKFNRMFLRAGIHFNWKVVKVSYAYKIVGVDYTQLNLVGDVSAEDFSTAERLASDNPTFFRSSSLRMQMGPRHAQLYVEMNFNNIPEHMRNFYFYEKIGGIGVIVDINEFYKKSNNSKK